MCTSFASQRYHKQHLCTQATFSVDKIKYLAVVVCCCRARTRPPCNPCPPLSRHGRSPVEILGLIRNEKMTIEEVRAGDITSSVGEAHFRPNLCTSVISSTYERVKRPQNLEVKDEFPTSLLIPSKPYLKVLTNDCIFLVRQVEWIGDEA